MKKNLFLGLSCLLMLSGCSSNRLAKSELSYKVFPNTSSTKYEFNLGIAPTIDNRQVKFVASNDNYFKEDIKKSINNTIFEEIKATSAFKTVKVLDKDISFLPGSLEIQDLKRTQGRDAILLTEIENFNVNIRQLSDEDSSSYVQLTIFGNISYKVILSDTESIIFLTTIDSSDSKVVKLDENLYNTINEMSAESLRNNIQQAMTKFLKHSDSLINQQAKR